MKVTINFSFVGFCALSNMHTILNDYSEFVNIETQNSFKISITTWEYIPNTKLVHTLNYDLNISYQYYQ